MNSSSKNRLSLETSAYLLQHATNPVDWYPWGTEALSRSKKENKPIFLSIGYSACHWCHVMERESFEDKETADILKTYFISIKVDREERPDLDHIYMSAVQALTHRGGWPLSVFLTPDLKPFYGGTYFPPEDRMGMPSFKKVLLGIANAWKNRPEELKNSAEELTQALAHMTELGTHTNTDSSFGELPTKQFIENATNEILSKFDGNFGGLGTAPKFFHTMDWRVVLRQWKNTKSEEARKALEITLDHWSRGGIYDHLGGGFHRYSTDREWLVPHFEKMLYDNALVTQLYLESYQAFKKVDYAKVSRETLQYVLEQMTDPLGGYFSTEDADSEGVEGRFYVWDKEEIDAILGKELSDPFCEAYGVTESGNWEHSNILNLGRSLEQLALDKQMDPRWLEESISKSKKKLLEHRDQRPHPLKDKKIILAWNGLMLETMAKAHQVLGDAIYLDSAHRCAEFVQKFLKKPSSESLYHSFQDGRPCFNACLDDYAYFINGLLSLFESQFDSKWLAWAQTLTDLVLKDFWDSEKNDFFYTPSNHEALIFRPKEFQDGALPSSTGMMITALVRLGKLTGIGMYHSKAELLLKNYASFLEKAPLACGQMLIAFEILKNQSKEIVLVPGEDGKEEEFLEWYRDHFLPNSVLILKTQENSHLLPLKSKSPVEGKTAAYVCENQTCQSPVVSLEELEKVFHD